MRVVRRKELHNLFQPCLHYLHSGSHAVPGTQRQSGPSNSLPARRLNIVSLGLELKHVPEGSHLPQPCSQQLPPQVGLVQAAPSRTVVQICVHYCRQTSVCLAAACLTAPSRSVAESLVTVLCPQNAVSPMASQHMHSGRN